MHHTLLAGDKRTGVTVQTLHAEKFDHGIILDQTPLPGFNIPDPDTCDVPRLLDLVSDKGAEMLVNVVRKRLFVKPSPSSKPIASNGHGGRHAPKISPEDRHIDWKAWTWDRISRHFRVLGPLWNTALIGNEPSSSVQKPHRKRIILTKVEPVNPSDVGIDPDFLTALSAGLPFVPESHSKSEKNKSQCIYVLTCDGQLLQVNEMKVEGEKATAAYAASLKANMIEKDPSPPAYKKFFSVLE